MKRRKEIVLEKDNSVISGIIGGCVSLALCFMIAGIFAWLIACGHLDQTASGYASLLVVMLSSFIGGCVGVIRSDRKPVVAILLSVCVYMMSLLLITAFAFGGTYKGVWVGFLVLAAGNVASLLIHPNKKRKKGERRRLYR